MCGERNNEMDNLFTRKVSVPSMYGYHHKLLFVKMFFMIKLNFGFDPVMIVR